ncbi:hypothetical protein [Shewanella sp.]|uniref:hypothetical protein n=1 Tax=Shewanella sp. TaxID=50422 RepID=UPI00258281EE|nr:hypothetical protein [Shewanella sp.]MCJ8305355.1 hypothetical protein [Shewanella sp.]
MVSTRNLHHLQIKSTSLTLISIVFSFFITGCSSHHAQSTSMDLSTEIFKAQQRRESSTPPPLREGKVTHQDVASGVLSSIIN